MMKVVNRYCRHFGKSASASKKTIVIIHHLKMTALHFSYILLLLQTNLYMLDVLEKCDCTDIEFYILLLLF